VSDFVTGLPTGTVATFGGGAAGLAVYGAYQFQRFMNRHKADKIDGTILDQLAAKVKALDETNVAQDLRLEAQDEKIHNFAVKVTRLTVVVIRLEGLLIVHEIPVPEDLQAEIASLKASYAK